MFFSLFLILITLADASFTLCSAYSDGDTRIFLINLSSLPISIFALKEIVKGKNYIWWIAMIGCVIGYFTICNAEEISIRSFVFNTLYFLTLILGKYKGKFSIVAVKRPILKGFLYCFVAAIWMIVTMVILRVYGF